MALNRSNLATAETPINNELGSLYSYPQWKQNNSDEDLTTVFWINEHYNEDSSDTYLENV